LSQYTEPKVTVIREGRQITLPTEDLVPGDIIVLEEGEKIPADAQVVQENDLTVNESVITGESFPVEKNMEAGSNLLYQGAIINSGKCQARVTATGNHTVLGKLGKAISRYTPVKTLLQLQIANFVKKFTLFGIIAFIVIWAVNYMKNDHLAESLLLGLTLALAVIPEEIPVAFSSFMALGAFHMARLGIITRLPQTIENLGAVNVICLDKTGTITENRMEVKKLYDYGSNAFIDVNENAAGWDWEVLRFATLASEQSPFDAMEKAIHAAYSLNNDNNLDGFELVYEYGLAGKPPMMTHVYRYEGMQVVAAKGAAEKIISICALAAGEAAAITAHIKSMAAEGYRVIGVAGAVHENAAMPALQEDFNWVFKGLLALGDPPKKNVAAVFKTLRDAKINIKLLTGDYPETVINIAGRVGMTGHEYTTGEQIMAMDPEQLAATIKRVNIFARMFPEAKLKVIEALQSGGDIVAMTGDGVNDGPALKAADIGIAMGNKGTEIARRAADLVLTDDNLEKVVEAIRQGRKIFSNFKKAIRYIISIHIPIIFTATLPVVLGWKYPNIFTPVHIIFLELVMGPTCSIFFEREPVEENSMLMPPRDRKAGLFTLDELLISIVQGVIIAGGVLSLYYHFMTDGYTLQQTRAAVFTTLVLSNLFLTFANRSFSENFLTTMRYKNNLAPRIFLVSIVLLALIHIVPAVRNMFGFAAIGAAGWALSVSIAFVGV
ncbi:MAG TPA: cation-translocating P-type ATPase, partial [Chitinophagaceae bacterium]|nr:cation-translocating P-type ATPase [Chitinophagaceae bacterium]